MSNSAELTKAVSDIPLPATGDKTIKMSDFIGKKIVLYFYPKDSTPGCTTEGLEFSAAKADFEAANCVILGASMDSMRRHDNFKTKKEFNFDLISDEEHALCDYFGVYQLKKNYGKEYMGIVRSTFIIDEKGILHKEWRKVRVKDHVAQVLEAVQTM